MGKWIALIGLMLGLLWGAPAFADFKSTKCRVLSPSSNLPRASCVLPGCPSGSDCVPPDVLAAKVNFSQPTLGAWLPDCRPSHSTGCWASEFKVQLQVNAQDNQSIKEVGVGLDVLVGGKKQHRVFWGSAEVKDAEGYYPIFFVTKERIPANSLAEIAVSEFCAKDTSGNINCVQPRGLGLDPQSLSWRSATR